MQRPALAQDFEKIQHVGMHLTAKRAVQDGGALLLCKRHVAKQADKIRLVAEKPPEHAKLRKHILGDMLLLGQIIQAFTVFLRQIGHASSPTFLINSSTKAS